MFSYLFFGLFFGKITAARRFPIPPPKVSRLVFSLYHLTVKHPETIITLRSNFSVEHLQKFKNVGYFYSHDGKIFDETLLLTLLKLKEIGYWVDFLDHSSIPDGYFEKFCSITTVTVGESLLENGRVADQEQLLWFLRSLKKELLGRNGKKHFEASLTNAGE